MEFCAKVRKIDFGQITITICIVLLATWCSYNVSHIWQKFFKYETIISLHNDPPNRTDFPGITICAPSIFTSDKLAELFPEFADELNKTTNGMSPERWAAQMGLSLDDDRYWQIIRTRHELFEKFESLALQRYSAVDVITKYSVRLEDIVDECHFKAYNIRNFQYNNFDQYYYDCHEIQPVLESVYESKKCFTYFSAIILKNKDSPTKYGMNGTDSDDDPGTDNTSMNIAADKAENGTQPRPPRPMEKAEKDAKKVFNHLKYPKNTTQDGRVNILNIPRSHSNQPFTDFCSGGVCTIYSEFADYFESAAKEMIFDMNPSIELRVKSLDSTVWSMFTGDNSIVMTVHPNNILQNRRDFLFFQVTKSNNYEISFTKKTTILLEPPYKTNCAVYDDPGRKQRFNNEEIATRDHCITLCIKTISRNSTTCIQYFSVLINEMFLNENREAREESKICDHQSQNYTTFLESRKKCEVLCRPECQKSIFEITGRVLTQLNNHCVPGEIPEERHYDDGGEDAGDPANDGGSDQNSEKTDPEGQDFVAFKAAAAETGFYSGKQFTSGQQQPTGQPTKRSMVELINKPSARPQRSAKAQRRYRAVEHFRDRKLEHFGASQLHWRPKPSSEGLNVEEYRAMHHPEHPNRRRQKRSAGAGLAHDKPPSSKCNAHVAIRISPKPFTIVEHQPAVSFEGFLGTIGGHIGIWLGLSLYKIIKFLVHIIYSMIHNFFDLCR